MASYSQLRASRAIDSRGRHGCAVNTQSMGTGDHLQVTRHNKLSKLFGHAGRPTTAHDQKHGTFSGYSTIYVSIFNQSIEPHTCTLNRRSISVNICKLIVCSVDYSSSDQYDGYEAMP